MNTVSLLCSALVPPARFTHFCLPCHSARHSVRLKEKDVHHSFCTAAFRAHSQGWHSVPTRPFLDSQQHHTGSHLQCCWEYVASKSLNNTNITLFLIKLAVCIDICCYHSTSLPQLAVEKISLASVCFSSCMSLFSVTERALTIFNLNYCQVCIGWENLAVIPALCFQ